jgi:hypothetical protein
LICSLNIRYWFPKQENNIKENKNKDKRKEKNIPMFLFQLNWKEEFFSTWKQNDEVTVRLKTETKKKTINKYQQNNKQIKNNKQKNKPKHKHKTQTQTKTT